MSTALGPDRPPRGGEDEPPFIGYRYLKRVGPDGQEDYEEVPLTEEDLLYPQEGDWVVTNDAHELDKNYLREVFDDQTADQPGVRVFSDHRIDFQVEGLQALGPDITVLNGEPLPWDPARGTFPVADMQARPLYAVEITSPGTRDKDIGPKGGLYYRAGVPVFILIDAPYGGGKPSRGLQVFQAGPDRYELIPLANGRYWLEVVNVWLGLQDGQVACYDQAGRLIPRAREVRQAAREAAARVAAAEQARAAETARANEMVARLGELEAELRRLRGEGTGT